ncbi:saccharopine dehydrogenase family protein [Amnibacterium setariae]|uniref:Saccharopine dehydrogenase NADP binding domain-containing protein n=1 Tax=Amnibacterium setariae TaxID=2306585 RepID=A0A3A1U1D3_9MICO|nr:NAD(P)H-binding protein [Amnibacterium setariae]RIX27617.1 hypothetical protein D1781_08600 [Amnibacterium setariae]
MSATSEVWVLGATGRTGRDVARALIDRGLPVALVGRDATRLAATAEALPDGARTVVAADPTAMAAAVREAGPSVVVNTVGPFHRTAEPLWRAALPSTSYVDVANDLLSATALLSAHDDALRAGRTLVTGAGFGVLATEAPLVALLAGRPAPVRVRVDSVASVALEAGALGEALAATIVETLPFGGRRITAGRLVRAGVGSRPAAVPLPDGGTATTGAWPSGDLVAAGRASGAPEVLAASSGVPTGRTLRALLPVAAPLLRLRPLQRLATARLAAVRFPDRPRPRAHSWGRALAEWSDGTVRTAWLRTGDAGVFTAAAAAAVAARIAEGRAAPGAHTPVAAVGLDVLDDLDAELLLP